MEQGQLRYFQSDGEQVPTLEEKANQALSQVEQVEVRAARLVEQLRALGLESNA